MNTHPHPSNPVDLPASPGGPSLWPGRLMRGVVIAVLGFSAACFAYADIKDRQARAGYPPDEEITAYYRAAMKREAAREAAIVPMAPPLVTDHEADGRTKVPALLMPTTTTTAATTATYEI